ncbi:MAG: BA14K family protein [Rhizobiaceae bacterium]
MARLLPLFRTGMFAVIFGCVASVGMADEGRDRMYTICGNNVHCGSRNDVFRPRGGDAVRRHFDREVWRGRNDYRPQLNYRNHRSYRNHYRPYRPRYYDYDAYDGSNVYLDFYAPSYRYYDPAPVYPRRTYRRGVVMSAAHVEWCYNRYRTYRERDNTYVPRRGVRAQCISPYS